MQADMQALKNSAGCSMGIPFHQYLRLFLLSLSSLLASAYVLHAGRVKSPYLHAGLHGATSGPLGRTASESSTCPNEQIQPLVHQSTEAAAVLVFALGICFTLLLSRAYRRGNSLEIALKEVEGKLLNVEKEPEVVTSSALLALLQHDVRAPLHGMLGMLQVLSGTSPLDPLQTDLLRTAQAGGQALVHMVNNVLDVPRIAAGVLVLEPAQFELRALVDEVVAAVASEASEKGLELAALVLDSVPTSVVGDAVRLKQVLSNLMGTAVRLTQHGHVFLCVHLAILPLPDATQESSEKHPPAASNPTAPPPQENGSNSEPKFSLPRGSASKPSLPIPPPEEEGGASFPPTPGAAPPPPRPAIFSTLSGRRAPANSLQWDVICALMDKQEAQYKALMAPPAGGPEEALRKVGLVFTVEDTGGGVPVEAQNRIAAPLAASALGAQQKLAGAGVQLAIAHRLVGLMGGALHMRSEEGVGSTVRFDLRLGQAPKGGGGRNAMMGAVLGEEGQLDFALNKSKLRGVKALVVDGGAVRQQVLATHLARLGLRVDLSDSVPAAALALRQAMGVIPGSSPPISASRNGSSRTRSRWDLVLVDADADGIGTGMELGRMVQQLKDLLGSHKEATPMPKLMLVTPTPKEDMEAEAGRCGFTSTLQKPLRAAPLVQTLLQALGISARESAGMAEKKRRFLLRMMLKEKKVMVVDDNFVSRKAAALTLSQFAEVTLAVESGAEAAARLKPPHDFDLVLLDLDMSGMNGFETARMVRSVEDADALRRKSKYSGGVTVRRVKMVGVAMAPVHHMPDRCHTAGMDGVISKPIEEGQLLATLAKIFNPPEGVAEGVK